ncbi:unnamed protein product [Clavelina lepadiformis]|uniref:Cytochrome b561 domain-containing protein n=1 Tax=Clavelina lepadiformis TaxID=159417 RepID=A0ABP0FS52_CLALP
MLAMVIVWLKAYLGGFAWNGGLQEFNVHPLCMILGMIFLYAEATLVYRVLRNCEKLKVKLIHAGLLCFALIAMIVGLVAVFTFHNDSHISNLYSLHSWCGIATISMFCAQFVLGFLIFLFPEANSDIKSTYLSLHQFFGGAILVLAAISTISGINEKLFFVYAKKPKSYSQLPGGAVFGNVLGIVVVIFVCFILFILQKTEWKRPKEEDLFFEPILSEGSDNE